MTPQYFRPRRRRKVLERLQRWIVKPDTYAIHWSHNGTQSKFIPKSDAELFHLAAHQLFARIAAQAAFPASLPSSSNVVFLGEHRVRQIDATAGLVG
jgi:hypothetical protein